MADPVPGAGLVSPEASSERPAEAAPRDGEAFHGPVFELCPDTLLIHSEGRIVRINRAGVGAFGARLAADLIGTPVLDRVHPEDRPLVEGRIHQLAIENRALPPLGERWLRLDGTTFEAEVTATPIPIDGRRGVLAVMREVAGRRRAETAARHLAAIIESSDDAIVSKDLNGIIVSWNQGAERLFGYPAHEVIGRPITVIIPPERRGEEDEILARLRSGQRIHHFETERVGRDGRRLDVSLTISPIRDEAGRVVGASKIARDIGERKRAEAQLREGEERFRATFDQAAVGIAHVSLEGRWLLVNRRLCEIVGYSREELLARTFQDVTYPEDLGADLESLRRLLDGAISTYQMEKRYIRKGGALVWVNLTVALVRAERGGPRYFISVIEDIDERKQLEEMVRRQAQELELRVAERTRQLAEVNGELEAFTTSVSHDLRAPLRAIQGFAQALEEDAGDRLDADARDYLARIMRSARKMEGLIQDLLEYSRIGRDDLPLQALDLAPVLDQAVATLAAELEERKAKVVVGVPLPAVIAHRRTLIQVATNLLSNAVKFVAPGVAPVVRVRAGRRGPWVRVVFEDNGIGIAPEHRERIFRVFERLHGAETYPGTGIGLAIVAKGLERMGGRYGVEQAEGGGSWFWIELPSGEAGG